MKSGECLELIAERIDHYLSTEGITGQLTFTIHCKEGGIGNVSLEVRQALTARNVLTKVCHSGIFKSDDTTDAG